MRITAIKATAVNIPYEAPTLACAWRRQGLTRTIIQIETDEGIIGIGECEGGQATVARIRKYANSLVGQSPYNLELILLDINNPLFPDPSTTSGIEMALWDIQGKAANRPVAELIGGIYRHDIPLSGYLFFREEGKNGIGGEQTPEAIVEQARYLVEKFGFQCLKLKGGVLPPHEEVKAMQLLRDAFGCQMKLRLDPNAIWSVEESIEICKDLDETRLEWMEDPTWGIDAMSRLRRSHNTPLATNMCVRNFTELAIGIRAEAVDVMLGDPAIWGGIWLCKKLATVCDTFSLGYCLHSAGELGVATAAFLHIAASTPNCSYAIDSHFWFQTGDVVEQDIFSLNHGNMALPVGPGLGVTIDHDKLASYSELNQREGDYHNAKIPGRHLRPRWWV